jgi:hypothetical protein
MLCIDDEFLIPLVFIILVCMAYIIIKMIDYCCYNNDPELRPSRYSSFNEINLRESPTRRRQHV